MTGNVGELRWLEEAQRVPYLPACFASAGALTGVPAAMFETDTLSTQVPDLATTAPANIVERHGGAGAAGLYADVRGPWPSLLPLEPISHEHAAEVT